MKIIPYVEINGLRTFLDSDIEKLWDRMVEDGSDKVVFYGGGVEDGKGLVEWFKNPQNIVHMVVDDDTEVVSITWINNTTSVSAFFHFCVFSKAWGNTEDLLKMSIKSWFAFKNPDGSYMFDVLMGMVPEINSKAVSAMVKIGCTNLGYIPSVIDNKYLGKMGAYFLYLERSK